MHRQWEYDSYSRLTKTTYTYAGTSTWQSPFAAQKRRPNAPATVPSRLLRQPHHRGNFEYDWLNNLVSNTDDSNGFYDRSTGVSSFAGSAQPHRLTSSSNRGTGSTRQGEPAVAYDSIGQVTAMVVQRDGGCLPEGSSCSGAAHPSRDPEVEMRYLYDGGSRVVKSVVRGDATAVTSGDDDPKYTVYALSTVELRSTSWAESSGVEDYELSTDTTELLLPAGAVTGRVIANGIMPRTGASQQHLLLAFSDQLGSATFTIDHATSELVEYQSYTSYGQTESDYRTDRWDNRRNPTRFTGKEEDIEVGLNAVVQQATTGNVNWGIKGVAGVALAGAMGGVVGAGVGIAAQTLGTTAAAALGGAAGGATSGVYGTAWRAAVG